MKIYITPDAELRRAAKKRKAAEARRLAAAAEMELTKRDERRLLRMLREDEGVK